tara:strand:- start:3976 stop:5028 length:1053 start_codon:yes stop_codon:yes gene_type:complete
MYKKLFEFYVTKTEPEKAHKLALQLIKNPFLLRNPFSNKDYKNLNQKILNMDFKNPVGLAAGFDKNAEVYNEISKLGFGFSEIGTVTPESQYGNNKPRVFRLLEDKALINRLGFPNDGMIEIKSRMNKNSPKGICGVNIGPNKDNAKDVNDYVLCFDQFCKIASYITINISSPNTPGLRQQHKDENITKLIDELHIRRSERSSNVPILFKVSPDINDEEIDSLCRIFLDKRVDGLILTNTSISKKESLTSANRIEEGGLSGPPIENLSNLLIKKFYTRLNAKIPIIGAGGVGDGKSAFDKIKSGASLIQLYTSLVYEGPFVANKINRELSSILKLNGIENISDAIGIDCN